MGTYRVEWPCCGSITETDAWEPSECPICEATELRKDAELWRKHGPVIRQVLDALDMLSPLVLMRLKLQDAVTQIADK